MMQSARLAESLRKMRDRGAHYVFGGSVLVKAAAFLGSIVLVRVVTKTDYGVLTYMENLYTYAFLFAGYGLNNAVFRYVVVNEEKARKVGVIDYVMRRGMVFNLVLVAVLAVISFLFPHHEEFAMASIMLPLLLLALPFQFLFETGTYSLRALLMNKTYAAFAVAAIVAVWLLKVAGASFLGLLGAVASWPIAYFAIALGILVYLKRVVLKGTNPAAINRAESRQITIYSLQYMVTNGLWAMFLQNDTLLIGLISGNPTAVASYKVAYAIPAAMAIISSSIGIFIAPYFIRHEDDYNWVWLNYLKALAVSLASLGLLTAVLYFLSDFVVMMLYGEQYLDAVPVMRVLLIASFLNNAIRYTAANLLAAMGRVRINLIVSVVGMILQVVLDLSLIPVFGIMGAAYTSVIVYALMAIAVTAVFIALYRN